MLNICVHLDTFVWRDRCECELNRASRVKSSNGNLGSGAGMKGWGKREIPKKTRRRTTSSGMIPTCRNPVTRPGIKPGSRWWAAGKPLKMLLVTSIDNRAVSIFYPLQRPSESIELLKDEGAQQGHDVSPRLPVFRADSGEERYRWRSDRKLSYWEFPDTTHWPTATPATFPTHENPDVTPVCRVARRVVRLLQHHSTYKRLKTRIVRRAFKHVQLNVDNLYYDIKIPVKQKLCVSQRLFFAVNCFLGIQPANVTQGVTECLRRVAMDSMNRVSLPVVNDYGMRPLPIYHQAESRRHTAWRVVEDIVSPVHNIPWAFLLTLLSEDTGELLAERKILGVTYLILASREAAFSNQDVTTQTGRQWSQQAFPPLVQELGHGSAMVRGYRPAMIEVSMEQYRDERVGETGDPRENPPTNALVRHDSHMRISGVNPDRPVLLRILPLRGIVHMHKVATIAFLHLAGKQYAKTRIVLYLKGVPCCNDSSTNLRMMDKDAAVFVPACLAIRRPYPLFVFASPKVIASTKFDRLLEQLRRSSDVSETRHQVGSQNRDAVKKNVGECGPAARAGMRAAVLRTSPTSPFSTSNQPLRTFIKPAPASVRARRLNVVVWLPPALRVCRGASFPVNPVSRISGRYPRRRETKIAGRSRVCSDEHCERLLHDSTTTHRSADVNSANSLNQAGYSNHTDLSI
ncbi:hypothetical protein PR048_019411 [Dryococelus australis]|uniref:Uncharacterized protein n=1 Tax=Dryococelus australis TaxID=614101 RepID=A0ABQ9H3G7_9NEOP|nr:hypothetical protein PR048_019411 [Dryococelus australis]